jgi:hypothetical protein
MGAQRAAARVRPEDLAQVSRQRRGPLLEQFACGPVVRVGRGDIAGRLEHFGARGKGTPHPLARVAVARRFDRLAEGNERAIELPRESGDLAASHREPWAMGLGKGELQFSTPQLLLEGRRLCGPGAGEDQHPLEARFGRIDEPSHALVRVGAALARLLCAAGVATEIEALRLERQKLRLLGRSEPVSVGGERVDRAAGLGVATKKQVEVRKVEQRMAYRQLPA